MNIRKIESEEAVIGILCFNKTLDLILKIKKLKNRNIRIIKIILKKYKNENILGDRKYIYRINNIILNINLLKFF